MKQATAALGLTLAFAVALAAVAGCSQDDASDAPADGGHVADSQLADSPLPDGPLLDAKDQKDTPPGCPGAPCWSA